MRLSSSPSYKDNLHTFRLGTPRKTKLSRRSAASTAFIGNPKSVLQAKVLKFPISSPSKPLKIARLKQKSQRRLIADTELLLRREISQYKKLLDIKSPKNSKVEELQHAVHQAEKKTSKLKDKITRFEAMFEKLCKSLEEGQGTEELKRLSLKIHNELNKKPPRKGNSLAILARKKERKPKRSFYKSSGSAGLSTRNKRTSSVTLAGSIDEQLRTLKNRAVNLIKYLKS